MSTLKKLKPEEFSEDRKEAMQELESKNTPSEASEIVKVKEPIKKEIIKTEPDKKLIADIVQLYAKYYERARVQTIMYYWELGKRLNKEYGAPNKAGNPKITGVIFENMAEVLVKKLKEIKITVCKSNLVRARKFAIKFPQVQELIKQQDMTWNKIKTKLLPEKKEEQPKLIYNSKVFKSLESWNNLSTTLFKILSQLNPKEIEGGEKEEYLRILKRTKQRLEKRIKELEE